MNALTGTGESFIGGMDSPYEFRSYRELYNFKITEQENQIKILRQEDAKLGVKFCLLFFFLV